MTLGNPLVLIFASAPEVEEETVTTPNSHAEPEKIDGQEAEPSQEVTGEEETQASGGVQTVVVVPNASGIL